MNSLMYIKSIVCLFFCFGNILAQQTTISLWPDGAPGSEHWDQKEVWYMNGQGQQMVRNVVDPTLTVYRPDQGKATDATIIVAPGGGFRFLSWETEGTMVAEWLASQGFTAILLKYRLMDTGATEEEFQKAVMQLYMQIGNASDPARSDNPEGDISRSEGMADINALGQEDGRQAVRVVRRRAIEWGIDPHKIGIVGFSAGGMVTLGPLLQHDDASRPDFAGAIYTPWSDNIVPEDAPPLFILCAADDALTASGSTKLFEAYRAAGKSAELHIYAEGGHGFGMQKKGLPVDSWIERFYDWMISTILLMEQ